PLEYPYLLHEPSLTRTPTRNTNPNGFFPPMRLRASRRFNRYSYHGCHGCHNCHGCDGVTAVATVSNNVACASFRSVRPAPFDGAESSSYQPWVIINFCNLWAGAYQELVSNERPVRSCVATSGVRVTSG